ncbi:ABC transporter permease [Roseomonas indoligenes]|uniref:ABC transporter permease n=1 Tax=Roseomonas indoligenes TaxID=2820811 RepID=A0A940N0Z3_9PROT|nr:ABC transporter permease [Pararoseomonas indoligenes]MBP0495263.1 ABC transporter permease [Pararoseomonas indoligenes]
MALLRRFVRHPGAVVGAVALILVIATALLAPVLFPGSPWDMAGAPFAPPGEDGMLLGTDSLGRDLAAGIAYGARVSLLVGIVATVVSILIGVALGATAGYLGGIVDDAVMRFTEFFQTIPSFVLAILLVAIFTPSITSIVVAIAIVSWPPVARVVRAEFLSLRNREFVQAAEVLGKRPISIVLTDILPNALSPIIVLASLNTASAILLESSLSFLGLGDPNLMTWGFLIGTGRSVIQIAWWMSVFPGVAIFITVLALNLIGEGLSDALNPRLRKRGER